MKTRNEEALTQSIKQIRAFKTEDYNITKVYMIGESKVYSYLVLKDAPDIRHDEKLSKLRFSQ